MEEKTNIAFMSTKSRETFPTNTTFNKFCNEYCPPLRASHVGPGTYDDHQICSLNYILEKRAMSLKGYSLGARTAPRFPNENQTKTPCPSEYQKHVNDPKTFETCKRPFYSGQERFPVNKRSLFVVPGAGSYDHDSHVNRKVQWHQSFGGAPVHLPSVTLRSTIDRNTEKLYSTKEEKKYQRKLAYLKLYY